MKKELNRKTLLVLVILLAAFLLVWSQYPDQDDSVLPPPRAAHTVKKVSPISVVKTSVQVVRGTETPDEAM